MFMLNLSAISEGQLYSWLPYGLKAEKVVFFPDVCPGKSAIPTGTSVLTRQSDWRQYTLSDVGCGMLLIKSKLKFDDFNYRDWDKALELMKKNKGKIGDLGSGNHF